MGDEMDDLFEKAERATPGPWWLQHMGPQDYDVWYSGGTFLGINGGHGAATVYSAEDAAEFEANAAFIAAANPAVILALRDRLKAAEQSAQKAEAERDLFKGLHDDAARTVLALQADLAASRASAGRYAEQIVSLEALNAKLLEALESAVSFETTAVDPHEPGWSDTPECNRVVTRCGFCFEDLPRHAPDCLLSSPARESGWRQCGDCGGKGYQQEYSHDGPGGCGLSTCDACKGAGRLPTPPATDQKEGDKRPCFKCGGTGVIKRLSGFSDYCPACDGGRAALTDQKEGESDDQ